MSTPTPSLDMTDDASKAVQKTPNRISLQSIKDKVVSTEYIYPSTIPHMTLCVILLKNGFALVGRSAPADNQNFDKELGQQFALEDALRQAWPLEAYLLREYLADEEASRRS